MGLCESADASVSAVDCSSPKASQWVPLALEMSSRLANVSARSEMVRSAFAKFVWRAGLLTTHAARAGAAFAGGGFALDSHGDGVWCGECSIKIHC